jgi:hypothetical protein
LSATPARGQLLYGLCGARLAFIPAGRAEAAPEVQKRLRSTEAHLQSSKGCSRARTPPAA